MNYYKSKIHMKSKPHFCYSLGLFCGKNDRPTRRLELYFSKEWQDPEILELKATNLPKIANPLFFS